MGHLGARVSALLDGQLSATETEAAWLHVYGCHACRDLVEREGWIKSQLAGLGCDRPGTDPGALSEDLKGTLLGLTPGEQYAAGSTPAGSPRFGASRFGSGRRTAAMVGGGAAGAAMIGVLAFGVAPASAPSPTPSERRSPATGITTPSQSPSMVANRFGSTHRSASSSTTTPRNRPAVTD